MQAGLILASFASKLRTCETSLAAQRCLRALVACHRVERQTGSFPQELSEIESLLGESLLDPYLAGDVPLRLAVLPDGRLTIYSQFLNQADDGGARADSPSFFRDYDGDLGFWTRAPADSLE